MIRHAYTRICTGNGKLDQLLPILLDVQLISYTVYGDDYLATNVQGIKYRNVV